MGDPIEIVKIPLSHPGDDDIAKLEDRIHREEHGAIVRGTKKAIEKLQSQKQ
jgi:folate-dependent phosphoribosylglycinamide formyltransferase PurN